jgi:2',3'-cyclic-nucleotide 2'-phosphodiesterase (5'-nucleotidase family)
MRGLRPVLLLLAALAVSAAAQEERELTILYSSSLNGNLDGCDCKSGPRAGLVKRAAWIRALPRAERRRCVLVDTGDVLDAFYDRPLAEHVLEAYREIDYTAVAVGDQEFANGVEAFLEYLERYPLMSHNLTVCPDETRCVFVSTAPLILKKAGLRLGIFALIDPEVFTLYPPHLKEMLKITPPETAAANMVGRLRAAEPAVDLTLLLYHGTVDSARKLLRRTAGIDVAVIGHEQRLVEAQKVGGAVLVSPGEEGNRMGILRVTVGSGGVSSYHNTFRLFSYLEDPDDPDVRRRIDSYKDALRSKIRSD